MVRNVFEKIQTITSAITSSSLFPAIAKSWKYFPATRLSSRRCASRAASSGSWVYSRFRFMTEIFLPLVSLTVYLFTKVNVSACTIPIFDLVLSSISYPSPVPSALLFVGPDIICPEINIGRVPTILDRVCLSYYYTFPLSAGLSIKNTKFKTSSLTSERRSLGLPLMITQSCTAGTHARLMTESSWKEIQLFASIGYRLPLHPEILPTFFLPPPGSHRIIRIKWAEGVITGVMSSSKSNSFHMLVKQNFRDHLRFSDREKPFLEIKIF